LAHDLLVPGLNAKGIIGAGYPLEAHVINGLRAGVPDVGLYGRLSGVFTVNYDMGRGFPQVHLSCLGTTPFPRYPVTFSGYLPEFSRLKFEHLGLVVDLSGLLTPRHICQDCSRQREDGKREGGHGSQLEREDIGHGRILAWLNSSDGHPAT
jgi:hypothetical protein